MSKSIQFKLQPLPAFNLHLHDSYWLLHLQYGEEGDKKQGDYVSGDIVINNEAADILSGRSSKRSVSYAPGSIAAYSSFDNESEAEAAFDIAFNESPKALSYKKFLEMLDVGIDEQPTEIYSWFAKAEHQVKEVESKKLAKVNTDKVNFILKSVSDKGYKH